MNMTKAAEAIVKDFLEAKISFGKGIKQLREIKGYTQEQVARGIDVSLTYYCMLENSRVTNPSLQIAMRILHFYGIAFPFEKPVKNGFMAKEVPQFNKTIPLQYPKEIPEDEIENWIIIDKKIPVDFIVTAYDESMKGRGIKHLDNVTCTRDLSPKNGNIVAARTDKKGNYVIRNFLQYKDEAMLVPTDEKHEIIPAKNAEIMGVAVGIIHVLNHKALQ
jgi:SOS-response transcriptional repressor LexA